MTPKGLTRCPVCGEYRGPVVETDKHGFTEELEVSCICDGVPCPSCRKNKVRRPISNYFDEVDGQIWHVPYFGLRPCWECELKGR